MSSPADLHPAPVRLMNGRFDPLTLEQCVQRLFADMASGQRGWLATVNVAILMMMRENPELQRFVDRATWTVADGQPLIWASRWFGTPLPERVTGVDLVECLCERAQADGLGIYLLGASQDIIDTLAQRLGQRYPRLRLHHANGYFQADEAPARAAAVAATGASILLVGMGVPRQEHFIEHQWDHLGVKLAIGVGGSFDVLAGLRDRAPLWVQRIGMEWAYRLVQEPRRLWRRYLVTNTRFVLLLLRALARASYRTR
jgi:N-acetylglucosaminyldiphosphoundecaprenol N-acetyl-beta-D-mannosaminyltransferase